MANLDSILRNGVALANTITDSLQATITHSTFTGQDAYGSATYSSPVTRTAIVEKREKLHQIVGGSGGQPQMVMTVAKVTFLTPVHIDSRDKITLSDGTTGPIVDVQGVVDPSTNLPYAPEVWLGTGKVGGFA